MTGAGNADEAHWYAAPAEAAVHCLWTRAEQDGGKGTDRRQHGRGHARDGGGGAPRWSRLLSRAATPPCAHQLPVVRTVLQPRLCAAMTLLQVECEHQLDIERDRLAGGGRTEFCEIGSQMDELRHQSPYMHHGPCVACPARTSHLLVPTRCRPSLACAHVLPTDIAVLALAAGTPSLCGAWRCLKSGWRSVTRVALPWRTPLQVQSVAWPLMLACISASMRVFLPAR